MNLLDRLAGILFGPDPSVPELEVPSDAVKVYGHELADAFFKGGAKTWNDYRLIAIGDSYLSPFEGQWPRIVETSYLELGEGDEQTVYLTTADNMWDSCPLNMGEYVLLARDVEN